MIDLFVCGAELPPVDIAVTTRSIVASALATRDYQDVHHDLPRARELGTPDIFMNILTSNGYVERYVDRWRAPNSEIESIELRLGTSNFPGDTMRLTGKVEAVEGNRATLSVTGLNVRGAHVLASVVVRRAA
ncbi:MaoC/PaaZ C-terminal domain-containing protein [uncultured Sphingomonas sp.]|uniref:MaoC/PaaZ C-terminal domain-containing protein n=1 Tax=uncultured Sphingomonas sp. TaxID=158754 RepID=UPI002630632A|nr:MaoC/PaaZ C-terminal domain-containing protein [uncultured Sphingomonas sp.]